MTITKPLSIPRLRVVDFSTEHLTPDIQHWRDRQFVPYAASCSRQIWFGDVDQFHDFPVGEEDGAPIRFLRSDQAYADLLAVLSGYESKRVGEQHIRGQFAEGWKTFVKNHPIEANYMQSLVGKIKADARFIHHEISSGFKEVCEAQIARDLSGQSKGDRILVISDKGRYGDISTLTERIIRVSENLQKHNDNFITIAPPSGKDFLLMASEIEKMRQQAKIKTDVDVCNFSAIESHILNARHVYVVTAMGHSILTDKRIIQAWKQREQKDGYLVHLRGDPHRRGGSAVPWIGAGLSEENYISPEAIRQERARRNRNNSDVIERAKRAFDICARIRDKGELPSKIIPREYPELVASLDADM